MPVMPVIDESLNSSCASFESRRGSHVDGDEVHAVVGWVVEGRTFEPGECEVRQELFARSVEDDVSLLGVCDMLSVHL